MKRHGKPQARAADYGLAVDQFIDRESIMGRMELNALMRGNRCGMMTDTQLFEWLDGANLTRHPDDFGTFEVLFGFDRHAQDFVVIKSKALNGRHFALIAQP